jgi:hypothetical protein
MSEPDKIHAPSLTNPDGSKFTNNNYAYLYNGEGQKDEENILNNNGPNSLPEKSMVCWNCLSILTVKPTWGLVQCPNCDKFNRVPDCDEGEKTRLKLDKNNLDIASPYVYVVMTCPFCKEDNKVKKETEHVICCNCYNSFSIENPTIKCISSKKPVTISNKVTRVSDINFPDPMFFRGYYPQPNPIMEYPCHGCENNSELVEDITKEIRNMRIKKEKTKDVYDKWDALRQMIRDVGEIENKRNQDMNINEKMRSSLKSMPKNQEITYEPNPRYRYGNYGNKNVNNYNINDNNKSSFLPSSNFYRRMPTPNNFNGSKTSIINKMMFTSWNNN